MTKSEVQSQIDSLIANFDATNTETLTQTKLTELTDEIAQLLETVNPNGPGYPSTPK